MTHPTPWCSCPDPSKCFDGLTCCPQGRTPESRAENVSAAYWIILAMAIAFLVALVFEPVYGQDDPVSYTYSVSPAFVYEPAREFAVIYPDGTIELKATKEEIKKYAKEHAREIDGQLFAWLINVLETRERQEAQEKELRTLRAQVERLGKLLEMKK